MANVDVALATCSSILAFSNSVVCAGILYVFTCKTSELDHSLFSASCAFLLRFLLLELVLRIFSYFQPIVCLSMMDYEVRNNFRMNVLQGWGS